MDKKYNIHIIQNGHKIRTEVWTWFGQRNKKGQRVLSNHTLYAADTELLMSDNKIVGGYSYVFNNSNELVVEPIEMSDLLSDIEFLLHLVPEWVKRVPKGLDPTFYGTLTYDGDIAVKERYDRLVKLVENNQKEKK